MLGLVFLILSGYLLMKVTASQTAKKDQQNSPESRFNKAWQRVVNQRKKNQQLQQEATLFADSVIEQVRKSEQNYAYMLYIVCRRFLDFYQRKSLTLWQRDVLMGWFLEYYQTLASSPFADHLDLDRLKQECQTTMEQIHPEMAEEFKQIQMEAEESDLFDEPNDHAEDKEESIEEPSMEDMFEDLFRDFIDESNDDPLNQENDFFSDFFHQQQAEAEKQREEEKALDKLMKTGALNKLFRKLLRQLHPDLEQDEERQRTKNQLVSQLTDARDNGDIGTIFSMYADHIGESPLLALGDVDLDNATKILQRQFEQLRDQKDDIVMDAGPIIASVYFRFYRKTKKASQKAIDDHIQELEHDTQALKKFIVNVTSLAKLKPYLEERYEATYLSSF